MDSVDVDIVYIPPRMKNRKLCKEPMRSLNKFYSTTFLALSALMLLPVQDSHAAPLQIDERIGGLSLESLNVRSFDKPGADYNAFSPFSAFTSDKVYSMDSFAGSSITGGALEVILVSEAAGFSKRNTFGALDSNGKFKSIIKGEDRPSDSAIGQFKSDEQYTFALKRSSTVFSSIDSDNPTDKDGTPQAHMMVKEVTKAGSAFIKRANLANFSWTVDLMVGDLIFFIEDLKYSESDFDYNDMVVIVRQTQGQTDIPEPSTLLLLGSALAAGRIRRKKA